ncbi:hypothetical protein S7335_5365 [Synechococcus sp. PCC 7335]|uniref:hypothetical protein n=1 Tax=Synechococcus sp. (strain ATCC 29403 / PCC 7335) TaxID=91464 RepID=UPI00017ED29C|nr:hypothetical protein [Synechococcus sp. PCC 7335]EDX87655.1 hypothetical protein S7335_5365 [Synechococcus sp. PCC 7335]
MNLHAAQTCISGFRLGALGLSVGVSTSVASWLITEPAALAQVYTADPVCYLHGADGRQHDLTALCSSFGTEAVPTNQDSVETDPETNPGTGVEVDQLSNPPALEDTMRAIDEATRLLDLPNLLDLTNSDS